MKKKLDILNWFMLLIVLFSTACGYDDLVVSDVYEEEPPTPYVELLISFPSVNPTSTRANPVAGEEGNGREHGVYNEDKIHDINIFFYKDVNGLDGEDDSKILHHIYFNLENPSDKDNSTLLQETSPIFEKNYLKLQFGLTDKFQELVEGSKFAAIANIGPIQEGEITNLKQLRELDVSAYSNTWSERYDEFSVNAEKMDYFLMSTAYNINYKYGDYQSTGTNQIEKNGNNYSGTTTLERMYARLDLWYNSKMNAGVDDNNQSGSGISDRLEYAIDDTGNKLYVYNILPVNVMQKPSYLFKKVTSKLNSPDSWKCDDLMKVKSFNWGGLEDTDVSGIPSTYVMERTTTQKKLDGSTLSDYTDWFGDSRVDKVIDNIQNADNGKFGVYYSESRVASGNDPTTYDCDRISIISYANENTHPTDCFHSNYLTGLAFRGIYIPAKIYKGYTSASVEAEGSLIEMTAADKVDFDTEKGEIYRYSPSNREEVRESEALYFSNYEALEAYRKDHPEDSAIETRFSAVGAPDENQLGFVCYYNLWLRHYNDEKADPHMSYPMEYATVRNNIYRVKVSFNGPGDPEPTMREPDTMQARIFVRKWNYREEETFYFD